MRLSLQIDNNTKGRASQSIDIQDAKLESAKEEVSDKNDISPSSPRQGSPDMINAESSPLSPYKKGRNDCVVGEEINFTTKSMEKKPNQPFQGFTLKNTIEMNTSGPAVA